MHAMRPIPIYTKQFRDILVATGVALLDSYNFLQNFFPQKDGNRKTTAY